jgi:crotonobetainyl-CoA:carnitine CoA-transferase CaiB-like acyl-CoA transferase
MLGAEVVKIERPEGDDARGWGPPFHAGIACTFHTMNRNKRSVVLDLKDAEAIAWLRDFIKGRDILVHNMRPGAMEGLGLDAASLHAINPRLIYCSLHAYGAAGPMRMKPGYEPILQAFSGMFSVNGTADGPPARVGPQVLDLGTGLWAALGWLTVVFAGFNETGQQPPRHRTGNPKLIVFQAFDTADGEIVVAAANDRLFAKLTAVLGHPEWGADPRFRTNADRIAHRDILLPMLEEVMRSRGSEEWSDMLEAAGIPCSPIHDLAAVAAHPQTRALGIMQPMPGYALKGVGLPVSFDGTRPPVTSGAPALGESNAALGAPAPRKPAK